jgi:hypothetical protein
VRRFRKRRKTKAATPHSVAKISIDVMIMPASAPVDSVIDLEDARGLIEGVLVAVTELVAAAELPMATVNALFVAVLGAGSAATLAVHAKAGPASL